MTSIVATTSTAVLREPRRVMLHIVDTDDVFANADDELRALDSALRRELAWITEQDRTGMFGGWQPGSYLEAAASHGPNGEPH